MKRRRWGECGAAEADPQPPRWASTEAEAREMAKRRKRCVGARVGGAGWEDSIMNRRHRFRRRGEGRCWNRSRWPLHCRWNGSIKGSSGFWAFAAVAAARRSPRRRTMKTNEALRRRCGCCC